MTKTKSNHYVNNTDFLNALIEYKKQCEAAKTEGKPDPRIPNYIGECFLKIAQHLSTKPNFAMYPCRDEMVSDGVENCLMYFRNFDPEKSANPFAYFTQIIYYAFLRRIQKEKKQLYVKYKATERVIIHDGEHMFEDHDGNMKPIELYENISEFIHNFEEARKKKKAAKSKGVEKFLVDDIPNDLEDLPE
jgi:hypothetical protein